MCNIVNKYISMTKLLTLFGAPILALVMRAIIFRDFFTSGWLKFNYVINGQWDTVIYLFTEEYQIPFISPQLAAFLSIFNELTFPILILIGLSTRLSAFVILCMSILIEITYGHAITHYIWFICASYLIIHGPGTISLDAYIKLRAFGRAK